MTEQKCIICGNIVRFKPGEKIAICEYCETKQEYIGETVPVNPAAYGTPAANSDTALKPARKISVENSIREAREYKPEPTPYIENTTNPSSEARFGEYDRMETEHSYSPSPTPPPPKMNSGLKVFLILFIVAVLSGIGYLVYATIVDEDITNNDPEPTAEVVEEPEIITSAKATVSDLKVGMTVSEIEVSPDDADMYETELKYVYYLDDSSSTVILESDDTIDEEGSYYIVVKFSYLDGYRFDDNTDFFINDDLSFPESYEQPYIIEASLFADDPTKKEVYPETRFSSTQYTINNCTISALEFSSMAEKCIEFTTTFEVTECTSGTATGNWNVYVRKNDSKFYKIDSFYYSGSGTTTHTTTFTTPTDINAVVVLPAKNSSMEWRYSMQVDDIIVKVEQ